MVPFRRACTGAPCKTIPGVSGAAGVTITVPAAVTSVTVSPAALILSAGGQQQFTVTLAGTGSYSNAVTWSAQKGTVTGTGLYTAPAAGGSDVVSAKGCNSRFLSIPHEARVRFRQSPGSSKSRGAPLRRERAASAQPCSNDGRDASQRSGGSPSQARLRAVGGV